MNELRAIWRFGLGMVVFGCSLGHAQSKTPSNMQDVPGSMTSSAKISWKQRRRAEDLYLAGVRAFTKSNFALASSKFHEALTLDSTNRSYQAAAARADGYVHRARMTVAVKDGQSTQTPNDDVTPRSAVEATPLKKPLHFVSQAQGPVTLHPNEQRTSVHMRAPAQEILRQCFASFGIRVIFDNSVPNKTIRIDLDDMSFVELSSALAMVTKTFVVPMRADQAMMFKDTAENRQRFETLGYETLEASSLQPAQAIEIQNIAASLLGIKDVVVKAGENTITLRGAQDRLLLFNEAFCEIFRARAEVLIDVQVYQMARSNTRNIGIQLPQQASVFNINAEASKLISDNQTVVDQAISSGLVASGDTLGIVALLIAGGYASSSPLGQGFAVFGGGISWSALSFGTTTLNMALNSSESHLLGKIQMRMKDGEKATLRNGSRYPIATSQYSSIVTSSTSSTVPQVQYEDLGLTLAATPKVHADDIELHLDLLLRNLSGSSLNDMPILTNRQFIGDIAVRSGETVVLSSSLTTQESKALSGVPGLSELPGFQTASTGGDRAKDTDEVLVMVTPYLIRPSRSMSASEQILLPYRSEGDEQ